MSIHNSFTWIALSSFFVFSFLSAEKEQKEHRRTKTNNSWNETILNFNVITLIAKKSERYILWRRRRRKTRNNSCTYHFFGRVWSSTLFKNSFCQFNGWCKNCSLGAGSQSCIALRFHLSCLMRRHNDNIDEHRYIIFRWQAKYGIVRDRIWVVEVVMGFGFSSFEMEIGNAIMWAYSLLWLQTDNFMWFMALRFEIWVGQVIKMQAMVNKWLLWETGFLHVYQD